MDRWRIVSSSEGCIAGLTRARRLLEREADWLPPWRDLLRVFRKLEARGEIRGGRFVSGFSGEQFAAPEALDLLRSVRRSESHPEDTLQIANADPLNLAGIVLPGPRVNTLGSGSRPLVGLEEIARTA